MQEMRIREVTQEDFLEIFRHDFEIFEPHFLELRENAKSAKYLFVIIENDRMKILFDKIFANRVDKTLINYETFAEYNNGQELPHGKRHVGGGFQESGRALEFGFHEVERDSTEGIAIIKEFYEQHGLENDRIQEIWVRREG